MAYEATAELYKRQYDLAKKRAQSEYESRIGELATQYRQANRDLEANLESRGILRSGEGMTGRVRLGAAEKGAQLSADAARQAALDEAGLSYMQQLAELQAKGYTGGTTPDSGTPGTTSPGGGGTPGSNKPKESSPKPPAAPPPATPLPGQPPSSGGMPMPGMPNLPPGQGGINEIGSGGWPIGTKPPSAGEKIGGPDRKLPNGGAVVDGVYIPPGFNTKPKPKPTPLRPIKGKY